MGRSVLETPARPLPPPPTPTLADARSAPPPSFPSAAAGARTHASQSATTPFVLAIHCPLPLCAINSSAPSTPLSHGLTVAHRERKQQTPQTRPSRCAASRPLFAQTIGLSKNSRSRVRPALFGDRTPRASALKSTAKRPPVTAPHPLLLSLSLHSPLLAAPPTLLCRSNQTQGTWPTDGALPRVSGARRRGGRRARR